MEEKIKFIALKDLEIYQLSRKLSVIAWIIYNRISYSLRKTWGDQMIQSIDSVGANIAEGYARYHYLEKIRFYYISRASLSEGVEHWIDLGSERGIVTQEEFEEIRSIHPKLQVKLNNTITRAYQSKRGY